MKKTLLFIAFAFVGIIANAQKIEEADFVGVVKAFKSNDPDSIAIPLERSVTRVVGKATSSKIWWGIGSTRLHMDISEAHSSCVLNSRETYDFVVRVANNN